jgi:hypothetical protein
MQTTEGEDEQKSARSSVFQEGPRQWAQSFLSEIPQPGLGCRKCQGKRDWVNRKVTDGSQKLCGKTGFFQPPRPRRANRLPLGAAGATA